MYKILSTFPELKDFENDINLRMDNYHNKRKELLGDKTKISEFANGHHWYGFHHIGDKWVYREWAPGADQLYLTGDFNNWQWIAHEATKLGNGDFELWLPDTFLHEGSKVMTIVNNGGKLTQHIPLYAKRVIQDWSNGSWCCEVLDESKFVWEDKGFKNHEAPLIYEAHIGMASEESKIATYREFADNVLPHIEYLGYNTVQLMAIMEHPFYGSFGYQVSNFFAASSRFGTPDDLRYLVNKAHKMGIRVLLDIVHSHAVSNTLEGINMFDGTTYQFFHEGGKGNHPAWGTKCFNYAKNEVLHFLLSNLKFWIEEYHFDGFRFDGITSMLYHDHALGTNFNSLGMYFTMNTDVDAVTYLQLANELIKELNRNSITIAEDMSGMPGMCDPIKNGGIGFDYRLGMGLPDMWIKLAKETKDEDWHLESIWRELTFRNAKTIAYVESHDQALVGDKTMMFWFADAAMYTDMRKDCHSLVIDRAMALHKMIRLLTLAAGGDGYLNFMGNEFGHPEWIDFPRPGNNNSFHYCRRQWSLVHRDDLKYKYLNYFDHDMIRTCKFYNIFKEQWPTLDMVHQDNHLIAFERGNLLFIFNFSPYDSYPGYRVHVRNKGEYEVLFSSDDWFYGGYGRVERNTYESKNYEIQIYLPARSAIVLEYKKEE